MEPDTQTSRRAQHGSTCLWEDKSTINDRGHSYRSRPTFDTRVYTTRNHDTLFQKAGYDVSCDDALGEVELFEG